MSVHQPKFRFPTEIFCASKSAFDGEQGSFAVRSSCGDVVGVAGEAVTDQLRRSGGNFSLRGYTVYFSFKMK